MAIKVPMHAAAKRQEILESAEQLYDDNYRDDLKGCLPSKTQSIVQIHEVLKEVSVRKNKIIVFAFDALSFDFFYKHLLPHIPSQAKVAPLTSVFPSTTASAWPSILTGVWPAEHGIYGTSFRLEAIKQNYIWISNTLNHGSSRSIVDTPLQLNKSGRPTLLTQLKRHGWEAFYNGNHGQGEYNPLRAELTKDTVHFFPLDYKDLKYRPQELVDCFLNRTTEILQEPGLKKIIWNYYDLDDFIHEYGYDALASSVNWDVFFKAWHKLKDEDTAIVLITDHGQTTQHTCALNWLKITRNHPWFAANTGGAGRVLYFYPKSKNLKQAYDWLKSNMGENALILTREEAFKKGLFTGAISEASEPDRIGDIIAIAQSDMFISAGSEYVAEHGALTRQEMIVPFVVEEA